MTFSEYCERQNKLYKALDALIELEPDKYCQTVNDLRNEITALQEKYNNSLGR